jgi:hypothetical protein
MTPYRSGWFKSLNYRSSLPTVDEDSILMTPPAYEGTDPEVQEIPSSRIKVMSVTALNNFQVQFINRSLMLYISEFRVVFVDFLTLLLAFL